MNNDLQPRQPAIKVFCGVQALQRRLNATTADQQKFDAIYSVVEELYLLDDCLARLRHDRRFFDERDLDQAIDRLRRGSGGGA